MELFLLSFFAGVLTVLAPCVFPLLPVIIGGGISDTRAGWVKPLTVTLSLAVSIVVFTLILKATTAFIAVPDSVWKSISGGIIIFFGLTYLFPKTWTKISVILKLDERAHKTLEKSQEKSGLTGDILLGASLGPVFSSCSPTYALILATVLPTSWILGITYLVVYALGLSLVMFLVAFFGQKIIKKLKWAVNPNGVFRKVLGTIFLIVGLSIIFGIDKQIEAWALDQ